MFERIKIALYRLLRWSEKYTKTDMVYFVSSNFWLVGGRVIAIASGMLLTIGFANILSQSDFGTYKYILAASGLVSAFSLNTIGVAVQRVVAQGQKNAVPGITRAAILWSIPASIGALGIAGYYFLHGNNLLGFGFLFIALSNAFSNGMGLAKSILVGAGDFKALTLSGVPRTIVPIIIILATLLLTQNILYIVLAYFASNLVASWVLYRWTLKRINIQESNEGVREAVVFGTHMSALGFFMLISGQIDQLLLWHFTTPAILAIYVLALTPVQEAKNLLDNFLSIAFPKIAAKEKEDALRSLPLRIKQMFIVSTLVAIVYVLCVPFLFTYLFPKYIASILVSQVLAFLIVLQPRGIIDVLFTAHGEIKKRYVIILTSQVIELGLFCGLIPFFGLWGAVAATVLADLVAAIAFFIVYLRSFRDGAAQAS